MGFACRATASELIRGNKSSVDVSMVARVLVCARSPPVSSQRELIDSRLSIRLQGFQEYGESDTFIRTRQIGERRNFNALRGQVASCSPSPLVGQAECKRKAHRLMKGFVRGRSCGQEVVE